VEFDGERMGILSGHMRRRVPRGNNVRLDERNR
jgi:hypothetical protein